MPQKSRVEFILDGLFTKHDKSNSGWQKPTRFHMFLDTLCSEFGVENFTLLQKSYIIDLCDIPGYEANRQVRRKNVMDAIP
jgi:hypothetical protein